MKNIVEVVKQKLFEYNEKSLKKDGYDFWKEHIKYVFKYAHELAEKRGADVEICELAALFHDMAMVADFGPRDEHEKYGAQMARSLLTELAYPNEKIDLVEKCVLHHRGSKQDTRDTVEEQIIADSDVIAHFDAIPSLFSLAYNKMKLPITEGRDFVKNKLIRDYKKLSPQSKQELKERFDTIMNMLFIE
jgi:uncharacterized protein